LKVLATKQDIADVRMEIVNLRGELRAEMMAIKADLIRWLFISGWGTLGCCPVS